MPSKPSSRRTDIRLLLGATIGVIIGGILVAAAILAVTSGGVPNTKVPLPFGLAADIRSKVSEGGPINIAGTSADNGFWMGIENGRLVALLVRQPKPAECTLRWRGSKNTFTCDDRPVAIVNLARYESYVQPKGPRKGLFMVKLRTVLPPPAGPPSSGG